jgi:hypothetical protein
MRATISAENIDITLQRLARNSKKNDRQFYQQIRIEIKELFKNFKNKNNLLKNQLKIFIKGLSIFDNMKNRLLKFVSKIDSSKYARKRKVNKITRKLK